MKKILAMLCCIAVIATCVFAAGCGGTDMSGSKYLGKWQATTAEYSGFKIGVEDALGGEFSFTLNDDGTIDLLVSGEEQSGKWSETENGIKIEDSEQELELTEDDNGNLVMNYSGMALTFEKE